MPKYRVDLSYLETAEAEVVAANEEEAGEMALEEVGFHFDIESIEEIE